MAAMTLLHDRRPATARFPYNIAGRAVEDGDTIVLTCSEPGGFTVDDLEALPEDGRRHELLGGELVVSASPSKLHQFALKELFVLVRAALPHDLDVYFSALDIRVGSDRPQPDLLVIPRESLHLPAGHPVLVVEVLSPSTRTNDRQRKRRRYAAQGVEHYWIVDPLEPSLLVLELVGGSYREVTQVRDDTAYDAVLPFAVRVVPVDLVTQAWDGQVGG